MRDCLETDLDSLLVSNDAGRSIYSFPSCNGPASEINKETQRPTTNKLTVHSLTKTPKSTFSALTPTTQPLSKPALSSASSSISLHPVRISRGPLLRARRRETSRSYSVAAETGSRRVEEMAGGDCGAGDSPPPPTPPPPPPPPS